MLLLIALFVVVCFSRSATTDEQFVVDSEAQLKLNANAVVHNGPFKASCSPSAGTNSSANTNAATWNTQLLIVSKVQVPIGQPLSSVAFLVSALSNNGNIGLVDIFVYNSTSAGTPGSVAAKFASVNLGQFTNGSYTCLPLSNINTASNGIYWLGFYQQGTYGKNVIARASTKSGPNYYYSYPTVSPSIGQTFPASPFSSDPNQLVMGVTYGSQSCESLSCSSCTGTNTCVWCLSSGSCIDGTQIPKCKSWTRNPAICPVCQYNNCDSCVGDSKCAWCLTTGQSAKCLLEVNDGNCTTAIREPGFCGL